MRFTARQAGRARGQGGNIPAPQTAVGASVPAPIGGWDAYSPISDMPPQNAVELINWFPQPGWVELRRGFVEHSDTGTEDAVDSLMPYQGPLISDAKLFSASDNTIWDVTDATGISIETGLSNNRWQSVNFATAGGNFLWICNGEDTPRYWNGTALQSATITGVVAEDMVACTIYRGRIWTILANSTKAAYLPLDSIQGVATEFDLGPFFRLGGQLQAIATWSTDIEGGTNEFIIFVSSYGEAAIFLIYDPTDGSQFSFRGVASLGSPIGRRCVEKIGSDVGIITIDGVIPLSQVLNYDRAAFQNVALTKNIRTAMTQAARDFKEEFGWQIISYPRNTMAILNVPIVEGGQQQQYVMNTINGAWCRFVGQNANCWAIFLDRAYFGGNNGLVYLADEAAGDEDATLEADIQGAYNYFGTRGQNKRWTTVRPLVTKDDSYLVDLTFGLSIDFQLSDAQDQVIADVLGVRPAIWNDPDTLWNDPNTRWPGMTTSAQWMAVSGIGYCAAIRMKISVPWSESLRAPQVLRVYSLDFLMNPGGFI
ncbi:hypothetical protein [Rhizobium sp. BK251]|uniref:hypothetical protein n=1 Tax=Rhizobium sp. BK251 TaxID=2512125 RepID=UPI0010429231|nr:hypothetical protein [Rhizobium sp. BK251]TCL70536.1 hypothetical protein EV286_107411 [Rhizobium sp. BK251]